jgi:hypothetical protein
MDPLSEVISFLEPRNYRVGGFEAGGDWSIRFGAYDGVKCYAVTSGACWLAVEGAGEPVLLKQGDCFLLPRGSPFRVASDPALPPDDWKRHFLGAREGALVKLNDGGGVTVLGGHFQLAGLQAAMLLGMLPPIVHLQSETDRETLRWAFDRMRQELVDPKPGGFLIVQHLAYMIFVQALRLHLDRATASAGCLRFPTSTWGRRSRRSTESRRVAGRWRRWPSKSACRDPVSRRDLGNWSAMDRSNISRAGGCCSPAAVCRAANPSAPSPVRSGMNQKVRSALPSSA